MTGMSSRTAASDGTRSPGTGPAAVGARVGSMTGVGVAPGVCVAPADGVALGVPLWSGSGVGRSSATGPPLAAASCGGAARRPAPSETPATTRLIAPAAASDRLGWVGLAAARCRAEPAFELYVPALTHHRLVFVARPPETLDLRYDGVKRHIPPPTGSIVLVP